MSSERPIGEEIGPQPRKWRGVAYALLLGLVGAGIVHGVLILAIPGFAKRDAWARLSPVSNQYQIVRVGAGTVGGPVVGAADPSFIAAVCRFRLTDGPVHLAAPGKLPFWSASVYDRAGANLFSLTDRSATGGMLDIVILRPEQMIETRKNPPEDFEKSIYIELPLGEGLVLLRIFVPDSTWRSQIEGYLSKASCELER